MALTAGSIAFTGFNGDGNDNLSFVALTDIPQGTVINFTDSNWNGSSFASGSSSESTIAWTATTAIPAGTVIDINNVGKGTFGASAGSVTFTNANNTGLSNDSEVVYAYVGSASAPTFLAAISNVGYATSDGTLTGTGLVAGQTAVSFTGGLDIVGYNGPRSGLTSFADYLAAIGDTANWQTQNGSGDQSADGTAPNAPFPTTAFTVVPPAAQSISFSPSSVSVTEGDSGTKIMTFTVVRSGGTTGTISFSGSFAAGTTNAADFGGALPNPTFAGSLADGVNSATVTITISGDAVAESDESFTLTLTSASNPGATVTIGTATATGTILNDDGTLVSGNSSNPVTLANNDHLTVLAGATLSGSTPVTWIGGSTAPGALVDNFGTISGSSRAIYTSGSTSGSFTINNEAGATITAIKDAVKISNLVSGTTGTLTITNEGTISSTGTGGNAGQALDLDDVNSSDVQTIITNAAGAVISAADADAVRAGANATIYNYGLIVSHNASASSSGNDAIDFQSVNGGGVIYNYAGGIIDGARHGITGDQPITVSNDGTITGEAGAGINMDSAPDTTTTVTNHGTIAGTSVGGADADGIDVDGLVWIDNFGTIEAVGLVDAANGLNEALAIGGGFVHNEVGGLIVSDQRAITVDDSDDGDAFGVMTIINDGTIRGNNGEAISIVGTFGDSLTNSATGKIIGGIFTDGGDDTLSNDGTITALHGSAVNLGDGDDLLINRGTITGAVQTGAGDDEIITTSTGIFDGAVSMGDGDDKLGNSGKITGTVDMGAGDDVVNLYIGTNVTGTIQLGTGNDRLTADMYQSQGFTVDAGDGDDLVTTSFGNDVIHGGVGNDTIYASEGDDEVFGDDGDDLLVGEAGSDLLDGGAGNDRILAGAGDTVLGGAGDDTIELTAYRGTPASIDGGDGNDTLVLTDTGTGALLGTVVHVEKLDVQSGIWRIKDAAGYSEIDVQSGAGVVLEGSADGMVVAAGAVLSVYGSAANSVISGTQYIQVGGSADGTTIKTGGEQDIYGGGVASNTAVDGGTQTVFGLAIGTTIANGGLQHIHNNVFSTIVNDGGEQNVYIDGSATGTTINAGGLQIDWGFTITTTISGGHQFVFGSATLTTINSGVQTVQSGGTASETTIHGGEQDVYSGGTAINTTMDGGSQAVYGSVTQTIIGNGAIQYLHGSASLTTVNAGSQQNVYADGFATGTTINAGGYQLDWGTASGTIVNGGEQYVFGSATGTTVLAGAQHVQSGGSADDTTIGAGALAYVHAGGTIDDVVFAGGNASLVLDQASSFIGTISGWQDHDSIVLGDILFSDGVTSLAYAANGDNSGGTLTVSDGTHTATLNLLGQYSAADFALSSDGHGGTLISDPGVVQQSQLAATLHG
ncbi:calcium-binding protein [Bradyrhizobium sp. CCH5-F6]|jgi:autotransporter passenger strand-loop-strand repeat protein|uniref:beta strand repeat-containing protein n=1 Tax=Bradyrhizobium sp. CCH5-F6 TaxID=1768753 RepID=UPI00076A980E|nr:calcium-binding protein [Bradyrhizobium sp. CCH5-F6]